MVQATLAYLVVALAFVWVVWRMFVPRTVKANLTSRWRRKR